MSHVSHVNESCVTCEWVMCHMWMSHVSHVNESHTYESSNVTYLNESCHARISWRVQAATQRAPPSCNRVWQCAAAMCCSVLQRVAACCSVLQRGVVCCSNIKGTTIVQSNDSRHTFELVMSHMWMSHVTHVNDSCHTHESGGEREQRRKGQHHSAVEARTPKRSSSTAPPQNSTSSPV